VKLSIIIPLYNHGRFLADCIRSIFTNQTNLDFEVIIVNDCSTDDSLEIAEKLAKLNNKIKVISTVQNVGLAGARNAGIAETSQDTDFIMCLDSDDMIMNNYIEQCYLTLDMNHVDLTYTDLYLFGAIEKRLRAPEFDRTTHQNKPFINGSAMYRRSLWNDLQGYDMSKKLICWEDYEFYVRVDRAGYKIKKCTNTCLFYRQHENSITARITPKQFQNTKNYLRHKHFSYFTF